MSAGIKGRRRLERIAVYVVLTFAMQIGFGVYFHDFQAETNLNDEGNALARLGWLVADALILGLCLYRLPKMETLLKRMPLFVAFSMYVMCGCLWSLFPSDTIRRSFGLVVGGLFGIYLAASWKPAEVMKMFRNLLLAGMFASIAIAPLFPAQTIGNDQTLHGAFAHKNFLGEFAAALIVFAFVDARRNGLRKRLLVELGMGTLCLLASQSGTGIAGLAIAIAVFLMFGRQRIPSGKLPILRPLLWLSAMSIGVLWLFGVFNPVDAALGMVGKDSTLTGRTDIWLSVWPFLLDHFLFGWGYGGFWHGWAYPSEAVWVNMYPLKLTHAHNSYLEIALNLGVIGLTMFMVLMLGAFIHYFRRFKHHKDVFAASAVLFLTMSMFQGLSEITLLYHMTVNWMMIAYFIAAVKSAQGDSSELSDSPHVVGADVNRSVEVHVLQA